MLHGYKRDWNVVSFWILETYYYIPPLVGVFFLALTPIWIIIAAKHPATRTVLHSGWEPVITAMVISRLVLKCVFVCACVGQLFYMHVSMYILKQTNCLFLFLRSVILYSLFFIIPSNRDIVTRVIEISGCMDPHLLPVSNFSPTKSLPDWWLKFSGVCLCLCEF